ncbi:hypothetical protein [Parvibium lacunae]|uniref:hypothetical protein n=1 Tax=Parvibium lacunae TaxID=1888893 RepID=UPI0011C0519F|nr:hypothetical protein [Parvibium lacunae]
MGLIHGVGKFFQITTLTLSSSLALWFLLLTVITLAVIELTIWFLTVDPNQCTNGLAMLAAATILIGAVARLAGKALGFDGLLFRIATIFTPLIGVGATKAASPACGKYT